MTLEKSNDGEANPDHDTMTTDGFMGIARTGRLKSAGWPKERRDPALVGGNQPEADGEHDGNTRESNNPSWCRADLHVSFRVWCFVDKALRLGNTIMSRPFTNCVRVCLTNSLKIRFARFLMTALPRRRPTTIPTRDRGSADWCETRLNSGV